MKTHDGTPPIIQPPVTVMTNAQLTQAAYNHARAIQELRSQYDLDAIGNLEAKQAMHAAQMRELIIANRAYRRILADYLNIPDLEIEEILAAEKYRFDAEIRVVEIAAIEQRIKAINKSLDSARGVNLRAALNGQLAGLKAHLANLKGESPDGAQYAQDGGGDQRANRQGDDGEKPGSRATAPEKVTSLEEGPGAGAEDGGGADSPG